MKIKEKIFNFLCVDGVEHAIEAAFLTIGWRDFWKPVDRKICRDIYANKKAFFRAAAGYLAFWLQVIRRAPANRRYHRELLELFRESDLSEKSRTSSAPNSR